MLGHRVHNGTAVPDQIKVAHNFPRSFFECCPKRCNSNDANSGFEIAAGELRATLSGNYPHVLHRTRRRGMTPVRADYTRKGALHQLGSIAPPPNWCNTRLSGVTPLSNKYRCGGMPRLSSRNERQRSSAATKKTTRDRETRASNKATNSSTHQLLGHSNTRTTYACQRLRSLRGDNRTISSLLRHTSSHGR